MPITRMGGLVYIQTLVLNRRKFKTLGFVPCVTCLLTARKGFGTR